MSGNGLKRRIPASRLQQSGDWRCRALVGSPIWSLLEQGQWPPDLDDSTRITTLKRNSRNHSGLLQLADGSSFYFKRFPHFGLRSRLPDAMRTRRGRANWRLSRHLQRHHVSVAQAEALLESRGEDWFLAEALPARRSLAKLARVDGELLTPLQAPLAELLAALHAANVTHGDLKWGNILLDGQNRLRLVDLDSARHAQPLDRKRADEDVARCLVSALELGMDLAWARGIVRGYAERRDISEDTLLTRLRPVVARISRRHTARYGRASIKL